MAKKYTMQEAVCDVLKNLEIGKEYTGRDLHWMTIRQMRINGNYDNPYDSSTLRTVRRYSSLFGVVCRLAGQRSKYIKGGTV